MSGTTRDVREIVMGLAAHLGVDDLRSPLMEEASQAWARWCDADPELGVVQELVELPEWTRHATKPAKGAVLAKLAALTGYDADAVSALVWLLVPGATRIADDLRDLHPDIDGLVAGQLWLKAARARELGGRRVAAEILRRTRREVGAELGVGDLAKRRDRVWVKALRVGDDELGAAVGDHEFQDDVSEDLTELMMEAMDANAIHVFDAILLGDLAHVATELDAGAHRGRMGLTTPAVVDELAGRVHLSARAIRRRASTALDRLTEYVTVRENPERFAVWRAQHTSCPVTPAEEMQLVITEDYDAHFFRVRDLPPGAWAPDVLADRRRSAIG
ncbi:MAG: hypothetical protein M3Y66_05855 [Actinomycetota bacterium]|nr:hypothetical protein [Actinomycetota bacterium]